jgi:sulfur carrier protein
VEVRVNDEVRDLPEGCTVAELLGGRTKGVAVAVNEEVVPRSTWAEAALRPGDRVEVLEARQGG